MSEEREPGLSRRSFLTMAWRRETEGELAEMPRLAPASNLVLLGAIHALRDMAAGEVIASPRRADVHAVRTATGILAILSRCHNDGALIEWRADDPSEDELAPTGRFYCSRDASIFNRLGELVAGPAGAPLPALVITEINDSLWADEAKPDTSDNTERLQREYHFPAVESPQ